MSISISLYNNTTESAYDISDVVSDIEITFSIRDNPGKATFRMKNEIEVDNGSTVAIQVDGYNMFKGFVFSFKQTQDKDMISVVCYDQLRYLKNKDSYVFENITSSQIFTKICSDFVLNNKVVDASSYICAPKVNDATSLYEMIQHSLDDTLINSGQWFIIRDNFGTLEHINVLSLQAGIMLGDQSGVTEYEYETSIDKETYNQIKLYRDNTTTSKREIFIVNDTINGGDNIKAWGILQYYDSVSDELNLAQIEQRALGILRLYNAPKRTLRLTSIGVPKITAGSIFKCSLADISDTKTNGYLMVTTCTHKIANGQHTMVLDTEVVKE